MEELIRVLIEGGVIIRGKDQWSVALERLSDLKIPTTLTGLLQARLDGLNPNDRETLQQASVIGRVFWMDVVERMHNPEYRNAETSGPITEKLGALRTRELIYRYEESASREASEFIFKNQILHDVTYESVLLRHRPTYHAQAAQGLVEIGGERVNEYAGRVGEHYEFDGEWLKAAAWYARAGRQAQVTYALDAAINYYQKALNFFREHGGADQLKTKLDVHLWLAQVLNWQAHYSDAVDIYKEMLKDAEAHNDLIAQAQALNGMASSLEFQGDHRASLESATRGEVVARKTDETLVLANALMMQSIARIRLGEAHVALPLSEQALEICTEQNSQSDMARCLNQLGVAHYLSGRVDKAEECMERALKIFQELGDRLQGMDLLNNLGAISEGRGDYETAFQRFDGAVKIAREIGYRDGEIVFLANRGGEQVALKNYAEAELPDRGLCHLHITLAQRH